MHLLFDILSRNTAAESINQKLVFVGTEEGKLLALRQSFAEVYLLICMLSELISLATIGVV